MAKLRSLLGFYAFILNAIPLFLVIITTILLLALKEDFESFGLFVLTIITLFTFPFISLGFAISGLMKDRLKKLAIIGLILSAINLILLIISLSLIFRSGRFII